MSLGLLIPIVWKASGGSLQLYASVAWFPHIPYNYTSELELLKLNRLDYLLEGIPVTLLFHSLFRRIRILYFVNWYY